MAKKWSEVVSSEGFQALNPEEQAMAQQEYFDTVVAPQAQEAGYDLAEVGNEFFTTNPIAQPEVIIDEQTPETMVSPDETFPAEQTEVVKPIPGADWSPLPSFEQQPEPMAPIILPDPTPAEQAADWAPEMPLSRPSRRLRAGREASRWADTAQPSNVKPGYRADGSINRDDPRWRGMDEYTIATQASIDSNKEMWDSIPSSFDQAPDAYTQQVQANRDEVIRPFKASAPEQRGQESMDVEALKAIYGDKPSIWDKANPETLAESVPVAAEQGYSLLDKVYTDKNSFIEQGMTDAEAEKAAFDKAGRDSLQMAAGVATAPLLGAGALATMPLRMGGAGVVNTVSGGIADALSGNETTKEQAGEDFMYGLLGGLGAGGGKAVSKAATAAKLPDNIAATKSAAVQDIDALAKQAQAKQAMAAGKKGQSALKEVLEGSETITAKDVLQAQDITRTLTKVNAAGGKASITDALSGIKNKELRDLLSSTAPLRTVAGKFDEAVESFAGTSASDILGLNQGVQKANRQAMGDVAGQMSEDIVQSHQKLTDAYGFSGAVGKSFDKTFGFLSEAQDKLTNGNFAGAAKSLDKIQGGQGAMRKLYGSTAADEVGRLTNELRSLIEVGKSTKGYSKPKTIMEQLQGLAIPTGIGLGVDPIAGLAVAGGKFATRTGVNKLNAKKLASVEKALGGSLKLDETAERMLAEGHEMGSVIGYLVAKQLQQD